MSPIHSLLTRTQNGPEGRITVKSSYTQEESWPVGLSLSERKRVFIWLSIQPTLQLSQGQEVGQTGRASRENHVEIATVWGKLRAQRAANINLP